MTKEATKVVMTNTLDSIKLITFNTWGLKYVSRNRKSRLYAIADRLADPEQFKEHYDIVALQEVWVQLDWDYIDETCKEVYPYRRHFKSGILTGPGLAILSKIPIQETMLYRFPINGRASAFWRGDFYVGKSVSVCMLKPHRHGARPMAILNAHMHAPYLATGDANYACHRACQAWEITSIQKLLRRAGYAVIQVGDLNLKPGSLPYRVFTEIGGLADSWHLYPHTKPYSAQEISSMTATEQISNAGVTCDSQLCSWRAHCLIDQACRLDYAFVDPACFSVIDVGVKFTELLNTSRPCSYSDHFAYYTELEIHSHHHSCTGPLNEHSTCASEVHQELLAEIRKYCLYTIPMQSLWRKWHFVLSIVVVVMITAASPFLMWLQPVLILVCILIFASGLLNGLICLCGVRAEKRALQEVSIQIENSLINT